MHCTKNRTVIWDILNMSKKVLHIGLTEKLHAHSFCSLTHLHRNGRIFFTEISMALASVYNHKSASHLFKGKCNLFTADILFIREIQKDRAAGSTCHLVHQAGSFFPVYILCVLSCSCILAVLQFSFIKEVIGDRTYKHLKRSRRTYTGCRNNLGRNIGIKTASCIAFFLHIFHDTCHKSIGTLGIGLCTQLVEIYNHFLSVALTDHMNHIGAVWVSCTDGIQVDTCGDNLSTIVVNMIADNFGTSRSGKEFCLVMMIFLLKIYCKIGITCTALLCLTVDFFQHICCRNFNCSHFHFLLFLQNFRTFSGCLIL